VKNDHIIFFDFLKLKPSLVFQIPSQFFGHSPATNAEQENGGEKAKDYQKEVVFMR